MGRFCKIFLLLLAFWVICAFLYDGLNIFLMTHPKSVAVERTERLWHGVTDDVAIFGSSRSALHVVPDLLSTNAYNYGIRGSSMNETIYLVVKCLQSMSKGIVIINMDLNGVPNDWMDVSQHPFRGEYRLAACSLEMPIGVMNFLDMVPGLRFQGRLKSTLTEYLQRRSNVKSVFRNGAELLRGCPDEIRWNYIQRMSSEFKFSVASNFQNIVDGIYANKPTSVAIVWLVSPVAPRVAEKVQNRRNMDFFLASQTRHRGVYSFNFIDESDLFDRTDFYDHYHLNCKGAERFTKLFLEKMKVIPELKMYLRD